MEKDILIGIIDPESEAYLESIDLRYRELRAPLNLNFSAEDLEEDLKQNTIGLSIDNKIIAVLLMKEIDNQTVKIRQVAVDRDFQGRGFGLKLSEYAENLAKNMGYKKIQLHARKTAVPFYKKMNFQICSEEFEEVGIPHFAMQKIL